jgi:hypothetical protein
MTTPGFEEPNDVGLMTNRLGTENYLNGV